MISLVFTFLYLSFIHVCYAIEIYILSKRVCQYQPLRRGLLHRCSSTLTCRNIHCRWGLFSIFRKLSPPISLYYDPSLIENLYKATNAHPLIKSTPFCVYDLTGRYSSVFFMLTPLHLIPVEYK